MPARPDSARPADQPTRRALVEAALHLFGRQGFDATSTRQIAARAGANVAAIAYHFGGKAGLRLACVEVISERIGAILPIGLPLPAEAGAARARIEAMLRAAVQFMATAEQAQELVAFVMREIVLGGPLVDELYARVFEPRHRFLCGLWGVATGADPESEATRLAVFAAIGQVVYFRIGRPMILRRMAWPAIGAAEAGRIADLLVQNLHAAWAASERSAP